MEILKDNIQWLVIAVVIVIILVQFRSFILTRRKIVDLSTLYKDACKLLLRHTVITKEDLTSKTSLQTFLQDIPRRSQMTNGDECQGTNVALLVSEDEYFSNERFNTIINKTNEYLCKNTGTSADLSVLEAICDTQKDSLQEEIHNSINVPLYLGLAGTFIGIIFGLFGLDVSQLVDNSDGNMGTLQQLINGIICAMLASLLGLMMTVYNSAILFKQAVTVANEGQEEYMSFLRRELLPLLSNSMAASLNSLKGVLGHFVDKFGRNLDAYADSAELLNDNLERQHLVLQEINQLSLTKTANKIAATFMQLEHASDSLNVFQSYQEQLNSTISNVSGVVSRIENLIGEFEQFSHGLSVVISNQNRTTELQNTFQQAIATHFPVGSEAREIWRKEFDLLFSDAKQVSECLLEQLAASTLHIKKFVEGNNMFFDSFSRIEEVLKTMVQYTQVQADCYKDLKGEILSLRKDAKDNQLETIELHKALLDAINAMKNTMNKMNN